MTARGATRPGRHRGDRRRTLRLPPAWSIPAAIFALLFAAAGFSGIATARDADRLHHEGARVTAQSGEVNLTRESSKAGPFIALAEVRASLPGQSRPVTLDWTSSDLANELDPDTTPLGWQAATSATGYAAPLDIMVATRTDGNVSAMAMRDVSRGRDEAGFSWVMFVGSLLAGGTLTTHAIRRMRPRRR